MSEPANLEVEQVLLGAIFLNNNVLRRFEFLKPEHFFDRLHQKLYELAIELFHGGRVANAITLGDYLPADLTIGDKSKTQYLAHLTSSSLGDIAVEGYARRIRDLANQRQAVEISARLSSVACDSSVSDAFDKALLEALNQLQLLNENRSDAPLTKILSSKEFVEGFVPPDYLVDGILQRRFVYSFTGQTGSGKTSVALHLCYCVATGTSLGEIPVAPGRVLFCAGENPDDIRMRWLAMGATLNFDPGAIEVFFIDGTTPFSQTEGSIRRQVQALGGVSLVVIDTSAAFFEGVDENDNKQAIDHARRLRHLTTLPGRPTVLVNCHPTKGATDYLVPRGGGSFLAEMDGNLAGTLKGEIVEVHWQGKFRGQDFASLAFRLVQVRPPGLVDSRGRQIPSVLAQPATATEMEDTERRTNRLEDKLLIALLTTRDASLGELAKVAGITLSNGMPDRTKVRRLAKVLSADKLTKQVRRRWRLTVAGKAEAKRAQAVPSDTEGVEP